MDASVKSMIIIIFVLISYGFNLLPYATTSILACIAMVLFGVIPFSTAFAGFASETMMLVVGMIILGNSLFETGAAQMLGNKLIKVCSSNEKLFLAVCISFTALMSAFASNTATVALMLPIISAAAAKSNGKITKKNTYMAIGFAAVGGGGLTLVGSTPQLIAQGILADSGLRTIGFFEMASIGLPRVVLLIIYFLTIGYSIQKKVFNFDEKADTEIKPSEIEEGRTTWRAYLSIIIMVACIVGFITQFLSFGLIGLVGGALCILTGCISEKRALQTMDWNTLIILGGALGFAAGLDKSGGGMLIADAIISQLGNNVSFFIIIVVFVILANFLANFMSHTATASILVPIAIVMTKQLGFDSTLIAIAIVLSINIAYATPIATAPITMTLIGGYRFSDYLKVGGLLNILSLMLTIFIYYLIFYVF